MRPELYGLSNCDSTRAAMKSLSESGVDYMFNDIRKEGVSVEKIKCWLKEVGLAGLLNKSSTSWRQLDENIKNSVKDEESVLKLLSEVVTLIKRPVLEINDTVFVGREAINAIQSITKK